MKLHCMKMASVNSSKSHRLLDFLPSIRPSFLSVVLLFACECLWMKNETTNGRLTALETRINMLPLEVLVRGSQWGGGFYGYRLKFWLIYGYRLIFFSYG